MSAAQATATISVFDEKKKRGFDAMINPDPFSEVRLARIFHNNQPTDKYLVEQVDEEHNWKAIPGVGTTHSDNYILVPNQRVHDLMNGVINRTRDNADHPITFEPLNSNPLVWTGKAYSERWFTKDISISPKVGGKLMLGIEARNSYDNSSKVSVAFYAMSVQCANQFHSANLFGTPFVISHIGNGGDLMENLDDVCNKVEWSASHLLEVAPKIDKLCDCRLANLEAYYSFLDRCENITGLSINDKKMRQEIMGVGPTSKVKDLVNPTAFYGEKDSLWCLVNAYSAIETHENPGLSAAGKIERFLDFCVREAETFNTATIVETTSTEPFGEPIPDPMLVDDGAARLPDEDLVPAMA